MSILDRSKPVVIDGQEYDLLLTTNAAADLSERVGGLDNIETAFSALTEKQAFEMMTWLVALLANEGTKARRFYDPDYKCPLLTAETVGLLVPPDELLAMQDVIIDAISAGMASKLEKTGDDEKNLAAG
ncbi:MAG: hypothetical protein ACRCZU_05055 [Selenomonadaceae bacterium]